MVRGWGTGGQLEYTYYNIFTGSAKNDDGTHSLCLNTDTESHVDAPSVSFVKLQVVFWRERDDFSCPSLKSDFEGVLW